MEGIEELARIMTETTLRNQSTPEERRVREISALAVSLYDPVPENRGKTIEDAVLAAEQIYLTALLHETMRQQSKGGDN